jgi:hypothetical protein
MGGGHDLADNVVRIGGTVDMSGCKLKASRKPRESG